MRKPVVSTLTALLLVITSAVAFQLTATFRPTMAAVAIDSQNVTGSTNSQILVDGANPPAGLYRVTVYVSGIGSGSVSTQINYADHSGQTSQYATSAFNNGGVTPPYAWPNRYSYSWAIVMDGSPVWFAATPAGLVTYNLTVALEKLTP